MLKSAAIDITGKTYGVLSVLHRIGTDKRTRSPLWLVRCIKCCKEREASSKCLRSGNIRSCSCCRYDMTKRDNHYKWTGGRLLSKNGYVRLTGIDHPNAHNRQIYEHTFVMSNFIGRPLVPGESVHHKNGDKHDNRLDNLELWCKQQPAGQRVEDQIDWAISILNRYKPELLVESIDRKSVV